MYRTVLLPLLFFRARGFLPGVCADVAASGVPSLPLPSDPTPEFDGPIQNVTAPVSREAILTCTVTNLGQYKVAWARAEDQTILSVHNRVITHNLRISVIHDDSLSTWQLRIRQLKESDRGCYVCQINTNSMKKTIGCIDVQVPPDINDTETSGDITITEGDNVTLICNAVGHPPPRITWRREDGGHLIMHARNYDVKKVDTYTGSRLHLFRVDRRQMGAYLCIASNDVPPAVSKRIMLSINFAPVIKVPNQLLGAPLNTDVTLECNVEAFPNTINYWVKNRGEVLMGGFKHSILEERNGYKVHMSLTIHNILKRDVGTYTCVATNSMGKADGTLRLYEIKVAKTKPPATALTTTATEIKSTVVLFELPATTPPPTTSAVVDALIEENLDDSLSSAEPTLLETVLSKRSAARTFALNWSCLALLSIAAFFR